MKKAALFCIILSIFFSMSCSDGDEENAYMQQEQQAEVNLNFNKDSKVYKLAILDGQNAEPYSSARVELLKILKQHGLIEGKNLKIISWNVENNAEKSAKALKEAINEQPDVIITNGTVPTIAAKKLYYNNTPINFVFMCVTDPIGIGVVDDFGAPPTANFTGVSYPVPVKSRFKFIKDILPNTEKIGLIYSEMPQSLSYRKWVENLISQDPDFSNIKIIFRSVPLITGEEGNKKMADAAIKHIKELNSQVDVFVAPNDQMGVAKYFAENVWKYGKKPLIGLGLKDVMAGWGATASIYPSHESMGSQSAFMVMKLFKNVKIRFIPAEWPKNNGFAFDLSKARHFNMEIPVRFTELAGKNIVR